jgi:hypothetical protein
VPVSRSAAVLRSGRVLPSVLVWRLESPSGPGWLSAMRLEQEWRSEPESLSGLEWLWEPVLASQSAAASQWPLRSVV